MDVRRTAQDEPPADEEEERVGLAAIPWDITARVAIVGIFFLLACAALEFGRTILLPVVSAIVIGLMLGPLVGLASRYRIPSWLAATLVMAIFVGLLSLVITLVSAPVVEWIGKAPNVEHTLREKLQVFDRPLAALRDIRNALLPQDKNTVQIDVGPSLVAPVLTVLTPAVGELIVFFGTLFFFLLGRNEMRRYLVHVFHDRDARLLSLHILNDVEHELTDYLTVVTVINILVGFGTAVIAHFAGLPNIAVWGVLAFVLNYIPYLGPLAMNLVLFAVGIVTFPTLGEALIAPACFIAMTTLEGHFITPSIMGRRLTLNPLNVFLALAFWTWLWGPIGAFLAVPLLITALVALKHVFPKPEVNLPS
ncbi:MAG: AI-2E family transporter [Xanthobacteraceae bacterium]